MSHLNNISKEIFAFESLYFSLYSFSICLINLNKSEVVVVLKCHLYAFHSNKILVKV